MSLKENTTFYCDFEGCKKYVRNEGGVGWFSLSYRTTNGSSGVTDNHYCETHEPKVIEALHSVGVLPADTT